MFSGLILAAMILNPTPGTWTTGEKNGSLERQAGARSGLSTSVKSVDTFMRSMPMPFLQSRLRFGARKGQDVPEAPIPVTE